MFATIGWNLRRLRVDKGLSQERLALKAGTDRSYLGRVERGVENVTISTLDAISLTLSVHVAELFAAVDDKSAPPKPLRAGRKPKAG
ncbi:helix-turn-helix domain-containing protein [Agrobacterium tumefaciens]|uniref:helix-turn-helix domain-containing protein n=1 Tax=Agrobacterium tumefaciens TaxID=358 RepID=UPI0021CF2521|nr:helix-turn-helix transcriptional regulator [Agrobacterium tumefaciens]UXS05586.1 helix-turn-helix transcriptional regulator [Agrobacterium tumefaciens]